MTALEQTTPCAAIDPDLDITDLRLLARRFEVQRDAARAALEQRDADEALTRTQHAREVDRIVAGYAVAMAVGNATIARWTFKAKVLGDEVDLLTAKLATARDMARAAFVIDPLDHRRLGAAVAALLDHLHVAAIPATPPPGGHDGPNEDAAPFFADSSPRSPLASHHCEGPNCHAPADGVTCSAYCSDALNRWIDYEHVRLYGPVRPPLTSAQLVAVAWTVTRGWFNTRLRARVPERDRERWRDRFVARAVSLAAHYRVAIGTRGAR